MCVTSSAALSHRLLLCLFPQGLKDEADSASASGDILQEDDDSSLSGDGGGGLPPVPLDKVPFVAGKRQLVLSVVMSLCKFWPAMQQSL